MSQEIINFQKEEANKWASREDAVTWLKNYRPTSISYKILSEASRTIEKTGKSSLRLDGYLDSMPSSSFQFYPADKSDFSFDPRLGYYTTNKRRSALSNDFLFVRGLRFFPKLSMLLKKRFNAFKLNDSLYSSFFDPDYDNPLSGILDHITAIEFFLADKLSYSLPTSYPNILKLIKELQEMQANYIKKSEKMYITLNEQFLKEDYVIFSNLRYLKKHIHTPPGTDVVECYISQDGHNLRVMLE